MDAKEVELLASREGLGLAKDWIKRKAIVESDCTTVVRALNSNMQERFCLMYLVKECPG